MEYLKMMASVILIFYFSISATVAIYPLFTKDPTFTKRLLQRRSFMESFCSRRCNMGIGGNVCKCNGFHFAGKRTSYASTAIDSLEDDDLYKQLEELDDLLTQLDDTEKSLQTLKDSTHRLKDHGPDIYDDRDRKLKREMSLLKKVLLRLYPLDQDDVTKMSDVISY